jgi:hypothetical protein
MARRGREGRRELHSPGSSERGRMNVIVWLRGTCGQHRREDGGGCSDGPDGRPRPAGAAAQRCRGVARGGERTEAQRGGGDDGRGAAEEPRQHLVHWQGNLHGAARTRDEEVRNEWHGEFSPLLCRYAI